jgi:hypothetical protein
MYPNPSYVSIALINFGVPNLVSIVAVSVLEEECVLSGAWSYRDSDSMEIVQLLGDRLLLVLGDRTRAKSILKKTLVNEVLLSNFLEEARYEASTALSLFDSFVEQSRLEYENYIAIKPADRKLLPKVTKKNLIQPNFGDWPGEVDLEKASNYLESIGKQSKIEGTPLEMETIISASRLVKLIIDMWRNDEQERSNRLYVDRRGIGISLLPKVWLKQMTSLSQR